MWSWSLRTCEISHHSNANWRSRTPTLLRSLKKEYHGSLCILYCIQYIAQRHGHIAGTINHTRKARSNDFLQLRMPWVHRVRTTTRAIYFYYNTLCTSSIGSIHSQWVRETKVHAWTKEIKTFWWKNWVLSVDQKACDLVVATFKMKGKKIMSSTLLLPAAVRTQNSQVNCFQINQRIDQFYGFLMILYSKTGVQKFFIDNVANLQSIVFFFWLAISISIAKSAVCFLPGIDLRRCSTWPNRWWKDLKLLINPQHLSVYHQYLKKLSILSRTLSISNKDEG
jgi:hypothetical protein